jgi:hypothetical protein
MISRARERSNRVEDGQFSRIRLREKNWNIDRALDDTSGERHPVVIPESSDGTVDRDVAAASASAAAAAG